MKYTSTIVYWIVTADAELRLPQVAEAFAHLGFPAYFRVELSWAKVLGVVLKLAPVAVCSRSGPTRVSPSTSLRPSSLMSRWAMARASGRFRSQECEEAATLVMPSPLSREASVGMLFTKHAHGEKALGA